MIHTKILDPFGRYLILKTAINEKIYTLINVYARKKDKDITLFFNNLLTMNQNENLDYKENVIMGFNCPLITLLDKNGGIMIPMKLVVPRIFNSPDIKPR